MTEDAQNLNAGHRKRLRARFLKDEGASMPEYELLEMILTFVLPRQDVKPKAKRLIEKFGSLPKVLRASQKLLKDYGLSDNVIAAFKSYATVSDIMHMQTLQESKDNVLTNFDQMLNYCRSAVAHNRQEEFHVIYLNAGLQVIEDETVARGAADYVAVHPKDILIRALNHGATSVVLFHNHPGGHVKPSQADITQTVEMVKMLENADIKVNDHLIITEDNYYSFQTVGMMDIVRQKIREQLADKLKHGTF